MDKIITITIHYGDLTKYTDSEASKINKQKLNKIVKKELGFSKDKCFTITRKSKRSKTYVPLDSNSDFRALARSFEVKDHLKLKIYDDENDNACEKNNDPIMTTKNQTDAFFTRDDYNKLMIKLNEIHDSVSFKLPVNEDHSAEEKVENFAIHNGVYCDVCNPFDNEVIIQGDRYKCNVCDDYDLCSTCYKGGKSSNSHSGSHKMEKISKPKVYNHSFIPAPVYSPFSPPVFQERFPESQVDNNCIVVDIPVEAINAKEYGTEIMDIVSKYNNLDKLKIMKKKLATLDNLLELTNGDESLLTNTVKAYVNSQNLSKVNVSKTPELTVQISKIDQTLAFHLKNKGCLSTPKNLNLIVTYLNKGSTSTKFSLSIGPHSIYPNGHKHLYYNMNGLENNFDVNNKFTIELIDEENQSYASGICTDGSGIVNLDDSKFKDMLATDYEEFNHTESASDPSSKETFVTPTSSTYITENVDSSHQEPKKIDELDEDGANAKSEDNAAGQVTVSTEDESDQKSITETIHSSAMTVTPEFVEVDETNQDSESIKETFTSTDNGENKVGLSEEFTDDDFDEDNNFADEYEVLSTDDYTD